MTPAFRHLHDKWSTREKSTKEKLRDKHKSILAWAKENLSQTLTGSLGSLILFTFPLQHSALHHADLLASNERLIKPIDTSAFLIADLSQLIPHTIEPLDAPTEKQVAQVLSRTFQLDVRPDIHGLRLDRTYGYIGAEQHLARYPGDTMGTHFTSEEDSNTYYSSGMAPGLGAWGYFAHSESTMTQKDSDREKYYIAVQTFLAEDFQNRFSEYRDFFKYRKMLVVNPNNGKAVVADIGDSGPAVWTRKHLGGSPEVMKYLERVDGAQKGGVLYFFINDLNDEVPLGPIKPAVEKRG